MVDCLTNTGAEFLDQPPSGLMVSPIGTPLQLNCTVNQESRQIWTVRLPGIRDLSSSDSRELPILNARGIQVQVSSPRTSQLVFTGTVEIQATVWCTALTTSGVTLGNRVEVRIYGKIVVIDYYY